MSGRAEAVAARLLGGAPVADGNAYVHEPPTVALLDRKEGDPRGLGVGAILLADSRGRVLPVYTERPGAARSSERAVRHDPWVASGREKIHGRALHERDVVVAGQFFEAELLVEVAHAHRTERKSRELDEDVPVVGHGVDEVVLGFVQHVAEHLAADEEPRTPHLRTVDGLRAEVGLGIVVGLDECPILLDSPSDLRGELLVLAFETQESVEFGLSRARRASQGGDCGQYQRRGCAAANETDELRRAIQSHVSRVIGPHHVAFVSWRPYPPCGSYAVHEASVRLSRICKVVGRIGSRGSECGLSEC